MSKEKTSKRRTENDRPDETTPIPSEETGATADDFNPVMEDVVVPGIVPPEGHAIGEEDDPATPIHETQLEDWEEDIAIDEPIKTKYTDGSTADPMTAQKQGLSYNPPHDPPVVPADGPEDAKVAAGFAPSMEESDPDVLDLPDRVDNQDYDLIDDIDTALRLNSETAHLRKLAFVAVDGVVTLLGTVPSQDDLGKAEAVVSGLDGVRSVNSQVEVADESV